LDPPNSSTSRARGAAHASHLLLEMLRGMPPIVLPATRSWLVDDIAAQLSNSAIQSAPLVQRAYTSDGLTASLTIARNNATFNVTNFAL
jgi:hypothetical protein